MFMTPRGACTDAVRENVKPELKLKRSRCNSSRTSSYVAVTGEEAAEAKPQTNCRKPFVWPCVYVCI